MEAAMKQVQDKYEFHVSWEPFLLRPAMPKGGIEKPASYQAASGRLKEAGLSVGIDFTGKCGRFPYTLTAHTIMEHALSVDKTGVKQDQLAELLFQGYFTDGVYPDEDNLAVMAEKVGLDAAQARAAMQDEQKTEHAKQKALAWSQRGISGVPYFIMNGQKVFSGAQESENFVRMFEIVSERFPTTQEKPSKATNASS